MKYSRLQWWIAACVGAVILQGAPAYAQSSTTQADIQALLAQIQALQATLATLASQSSPPAKRSSCPTLTRNLSKGSRGEDVRALQWFLVAEGVLTSESTTGLYGKWTEIAVQDWQKQKGIVSSGTAATTGYGAIGNRTRSSIALVCGNTGGLQADTLASKREQVNRARNAIEVAIFEALQKLAEKIRAYQGNDIPNSRAFAEKLDDMATLRTEFEALSQVNVNTATGEQLDQLLASYARIQAAKQNALTGYNLLPIEELERIENQSKSPNIEVARMKGRDARRIADTKQLQLALELYYDAHGLYPAELDPVLVNEGYIYAIPRDPLDSTSYPFLQRGGGTSYVLGANLEMENHSVLQSDADVSGPADDARSCSGVPGRYCYDVAP